MSNLKLTSYSDGFGIFHKVSEEEFDVTNKNYLRMFMLNTENKLFNYDELYEFILPNITQYVFSRKKLLEIESDPGKQRTIILDALSHLRSIKNNADKGAGGELGEILLYLFLSLSSKLLKGVNSFIFISTIPSSKHLFKALEMPILDIPRLSPICFWVIPSK